MNSGYLNLPSVFACTQLPFEHRDIDMINCLLAKLLVIIQSYCIIFYAQVDVSSESHRNSPKVKHRDKRNEKQLKEKKQLQRGRWHVVAGLNRQSLQLVINVEIQNTLQGSQGSPTQSAVRSVEKATLQKKKLQGLAGN